MQEKIDLLILEEKEEQSQSIEQRSTDFICVVGAEGKRDKTVHNTWKNVLDVGMKLD